MKPKINLAKPMTFRLGDRFIIDFNIKSWLLLFGLKFFGRLLTFRIEFKKYVEGKD